MKYYKFVGECGIRRLDHGGDAQYTFELTLGVSFLKYVLGEPPDGCDLCILSAQYNEQGFPIIALGFDNEVLGIEQYIRRAEAVIDIFHDAVSWSNLAKSDVLAKIDLR